jgi:RNA polymerase sigma-70 factor (ECF subfamily)
LERCYDPLKGGDLERVPSSSRMSELLQAWTGGNREALEQIVELAYPELHKIARRCLNNERPGHTIQATALVNEAYLKLVDVRRMEWQDRAHFFAVGARIMRRILVDYARARGYAKRGGAAQRVDFTESLNVSPQTDLDVELLDEALQALEKFDSRKAQVVEMRYFGGLTADETAAVLNISPQSVHRDWSLAKAWLLREMTEGSRTTKQDN